MEPTETPDPTLRRAIWAVGLVGLGASALAFLFGGPGIGWGVAVGALVAFGNLALLVRAVTRLFAGAGWRYGVVVVLKFVGLIGLTFALVHVLKLDPMGLAFGLGALPLGIVFGGGSSALRTTP